MSVMKPPKMIRDIQSISIEPEEIIHLVDEMARLHEEGRNPDWYSAMAIIASTYRNSHGKAFCIMERMRCMTDMMQDERFRGWSMQGIEEGCRLTNEAVFRATAKCSLKADSKRIWFEADEFFQIVLSESDSEGNA